MKQLHFIRINEDFEPQFVVDKLHKINELYLHTKKGRFRLTKYTDKSDNVNYYSFGLWEANINDRPGHNGEWSSNTMIINKLFNKNLIPCSVKQLNSGFNSYFAMAIEKDDIPYPKDILEWGNIFNDNCLLPKINLPRSTGYFNNTTLDHDGNLISPNIEDMKKHILKFGDRKDLYSKWIRILEIKNRKQIEEDFYSDALPSDNYNYDIR